MERSNYKHMLWKNLSFAQINHKCNRYATGGKVRIITFSLLFIFTNACFAIGWEEVSKENIEIRGISVDIKFNQSMGCNEFKISMPEQLFFKDLGGREFWTARYKVVQEKSRGWQLTSEGTQVILPSNTQNQLVKIEALCLSNTDLKTAYLSAVYGGPQGTPPMVILLDLGEYK